MNPNGKMQVSILGQDQNFSQHLHSFGTSGAITHVSLALVPEFAVKKCIYQNLPWTIFDEVSKYAELLGRGTYLSLFTNW